MTQAIMFAEYGGPEVLTLRDIEVRPPGPGEIRVAVEFAGVNPVDAKQRAGARATGPLSEWRGVGQDAAGTIIAVGDGVEGLYPGDDIVVSAASGTYAAEVIVPVRSVHRRPPGVTAAQGAAIGVPAGTAYQSLRSLGVGPGDTLLLHGGSGAVGRAATQLALLWGARVIATASPERFSDLAALGAEPVNYGEGLVDRVRAMAPTGATVAIDAAGTDEAIVSSLELVPDRSRIATIVRGRDAAGFGVRGFAAGSPVPLSTAQSMWRAEAVPVVLALIAAGRFSVHIGEQFALADAVSAHRALESGARGKLLVRITS